MKQPITDPKEACQQMTQRIADLEQVKQRATQQIADLQQANQQAREQIAALEQASQKTTQEIQQLNKRLQSSEDSLPLKLFNATQHDVGWLKYPPGVVVVEGMPSNPRGVRLLTDDEYIIIAEALGLPRLAHHVDLEEKRKQIALHLGIAML